MEGSGGRTNELGGRWIDLTVRHCCTTLQCMNKMSKSEVYSWRLYACTEG